MKSRTDLFVEEVRENLTSNILPYWLALKDPRGGFYGEVKADGTVLYDAPRGVILNARLIWSFAAAYGALKDDRCLVAAMHARDWFLDHFCDHKYGGVYWSVDASGERLETKKQLYAQGFAIYGLSELYRVTKDDEALKNAINLYKVVETHFADPENGGYIEALSRDFSPLEDMSLSESDINADKTMNSHLHVLEAYANLYRVWPDEGLKEAVEKLLELTATRIMGPDGHLQLYFRKDWTVLPGPVSCGHDIETSWLALECAQALRDADVVNRVRPWALRLGQAGSEGLHYDEWWVAAETVVGNLWLWKYHGDDAAFDRALSAWDYIKNHLVDNTSGEWWWSVLPDGTPDLSHPKAGFWKCPYHNTRMCLQVLSIF